MSCLHAQQQPKSQRDIVDGDLQLYTEGSTRQIHIHILGMLYNWWNKVWVKTIDTMFHVYQVQTSPAPLQVIHLDKVTAGMNFSSVVLVLMSLVIDADIFPGDLPSFVHLRFRQTICISN